MCEILRHRLRIQIPGYPRMREQSFEFRGEYQTPGNCCVIEGFNSQAIAAEDQDLPTRIPDSKSKHSAEALNTVFPQLFKEVYDYLRVACGSEPVAFGLDRKSTRLN